MSEFKTIIEVLEDQNVAKAHAEYILAMMKVAENGQNPLSKEFMERVATYALEAGDQE